MSDAITMAKRSVIGTRGGNLLDTDLVLIVDDDEDILELTPEILETLGYHVFTARNGLEAIELLRRNSRLPRLR